MRYQEHEFSRLRAGQRGTAAEQAPLVLYRDIIGSAHPVIAHHHRDFCSLYIIRGGRGTHVVNGKAHAVAKGDVYAMGVGMTHHFRDGQNLLADTIHFTQDIFDPETQIALAETPGFHALFAPGNQGSVTGLRWMHLTPDTWDSVAGQVEELRAEWRRGTPDGVLLTRALFARLLVHLSRFYAGFTRGGDCPLAPTPAGHPSSREEIVAAAVRYMDERFTEPLRIEQVAALVCLSPDRFTEVFSAVMGRTPRDYLRHLRLEQAKSLLVESDCTVTEVAQRSGFNEAAYLTRVLRAATGLTPRAFRQQALNPRR